MSVLATDRPLRLMSAFRAELRRIRTGQDAEWREWPAAWRRQWAAALVQVADESGILDVAGDEDITWLSSVVAGEAA